MTRTPFLPSARQVNALLVVGFLSVGYALYLRYLVIEQSPVGLACDGGLQTWLCATRRLVIALFGHNVFGGVALAAALLHLARPAMILCLAALAAAGFGIVLYNVALASLAVSLLILAFARPYIRAAEASA